MVKATRNDGRGGRTYTTPAGADYPSVTSILGVVGKPALVPWAAKMERILVSEAAADLWDQIREHADQLLHGTPMSRLAYMASLERQIGKQKAHDKALRAAGDVGTQAHGLIEHHCRAVLAGKHPLEGQPAAGVEARHAYDAWCRWASMFAFKPKHTEEMVWSDVHRYAGTLDSIGMMLHTIAQDRLTLLDWKSGSGIYPEATLQVSAYVVAARERKLIPDEPTYAAIVRVPKTVGERACEVKIISPLEQEAAFKAFVACVELFNWQKGQK